MLIGLLSDTHIPDHASELPAQIKDVFRDVDLILHGGDTYVIPVLDELERIAPVLAARGDDDYPEMIKDKRVKNKHILTVEGATIWLTHVRLWSWLSTKEDPDPVSPQHEKLPDVIVYGHTHIAEVKHNGSTLLVNPGSATFPDYKSELGTVALLTINSGKAEVRIVQLE